MTNQEIILGLYKNKAVFQAIFDLYHPDLVRYKPSKTSWCFLEIVCHLIDEEIEDFRTRVAHTLKSSEKPFKSITPQKWPKEREYLKQDYNKKVVHFLEERDASINWLNSLQGVNWDFELLHPDLGKISAKRFLANWLAHDYLHIRQLNAIKHSFLKSTSGEDLSYAGNW